MLNFNQLRAFHHAAKNLSVTKAAHDLCITQPAVTAQLKALEAFIELKLFKKMGRKIYLTSEGQAIYAYTRKIFSLEKEVENFIQQTRELKRGVLRIGTTKTYARYFMPSMMTSFHQAYPRIKIHLDEGSSMDMINSLHKFKNDMALVAKAVNHPQVVFVPFTQEELLVIVPLEHRLAKKEAIRFKELAGEPFIMKETGSGTRKVVDELFDRHGCAPNVLMETGNNEFIKQLVQRGEGISILVKACVALNLKEGDLATVSLSDEKLLLDVSLAYLDNQPLSPPALAFVGILGQQQIKDVNTQDISSLVAQFLTRQHFDYDMEDAFHKWLSGNSGKS